MYLDTFVYGALKPKMHPWSSGTEKETDGWAKTYHKMELENSSGIARRTVSKDSAGGEMEKEWQMTCPQVFAIDEISNSRSSDVEKQGKAIAPSPLNSCVIQHLSYHDGKKEIHCKGNWLFKHPVVPTRRLRPIHW